MVIKLAYVPQFDTGEVGDQALENQPLWSLQGFDNIISGLEKGHCGMAASDEK